MANRYQTDPEYRERVKAASRERYHSDPEYREHTKERAKASSKTTLLNPELAKRERVRKRKIDRAAMRDTEYRKSKLGREKKRRHNPEYRERRNEYVRKKRTAQRTAAQYTAFEDLMNHEQAELEAEAARTGVDINTLIEQRLNR
jgi:hypothetical protein